MKLLAIELRHIIADYEEKLKGINEIDFDLKPSPHKWSKKEELGHLIDSAHNNLRRFISAQFEANPKIIYHQNEWVIAANYQQQEPAELILLWSLLNKQICEVLKLMTDEMAERLCDTGSDGVEFAPA